jgi:cell division protease FtsH
VSIIPRGQALGITMQLPEEDRFNHDKEYLRDQIAIMMGGRLGEELVLNQMTTGASNDFERATRLARNMVTQWGMSEELGPMVYGEREHEPFLGREIMRQTNVSEETARTIDGVVRALVEENYDRAKKILEEHMDQLHLLAKALIKYETLDSKDIDRVMKGKQLHRDEKEARKPSDKAPPEEPMTKVDIGDDGEAKSSSDEAGQAS